jgi:hypothetical protein
MAQMTIADDGAGFDVDAVSSGRGLANLRARAGEVGAELEVESAPGRGTRLSVRVPAGRARAAGASADLQKALLLALAVVFQIGLVGRPVVGDWVFWSLTPLSAVALWLSVTRFRAVGRRLADLARRLGRTASEVLRLRRQRAQAVLLLATAACAWNPLLSAAGLSLVGIVRSGIPTPAAWWGITAGILALPLAVVPLHRALAALRARLAPELFRNELRRSLGEATLPLVVLLGTLGLFGRFLHEPALVLLPIGLALWLGSLGLWALVSFAGQARAKQAGG